MIPTSRGLIAKHRARGLHAPLMTAKRRPPTPSSVYDTFWRFACERQQMFDRRVAMCPYPWTADPILHHYRFTNAYRASDRVSQYLLRNVIYRRDLPTSPREVIFRILLFKLFNRIDTWKLLDLDFGPITHKRFRFETFAERLTNAQKHSRKLYSAAYIMPSTGPLGERVKHRGHLKLLRNMIDDNLAEKLTTASSLEDVFRALLSYPTIGGFLAFQLATDINYSEAINFSEMDFVVAGPGSLDGLRKCFIDFGDYSEADVIRWVTDRQEIDPKRLELCFPRLYGRPLQLIDVQNLFCEVGKYARVAHPGVRGTSDRSRIKQVYRIGPPAPKLFFPPKWDINHLIPESSRATGEEVYPN
jgi:hypothetical protein